MYYVAVIDKDADSAYGVRFPEVPGCFSAADTFGEIVPNSIEALSLFFEDTQPAPAQGLESVREQVADDIANGAVLMMIPLRSRPEKDRTGQPELGEGLPRYARRSRADARHDPFGIRRKGSNAGDSRPRLTAGAVRDSADVRTMTRVDFIYGLGSRYSYLASTQVERVARETGCLFSWQPVSSHALLSQRPDNPFSAGAGGQYDWGYRKRDAEAWAHYYGVPSTIRLADSRTIRCCPRWRPWRQTAKVGSRR